MLDKLLGNASQVDPAKAAKDLQYILLQNERIDGAYAVFRDMLVFTDRRLIITDKQGMSGKKMSIKSIPYKSIKSFSVETAGTFDMDSELNIWLTGAAGPISMKFSKGDLIYIVQQALAAHVC
jgi:hypothetical protein